MFASFVRLLPLLILALALAHGQTSRTSNASTPAPNQESPSQSLADGLRHAQEFIRAGKIPDALTLLDDTKKAAFEVETENLALQEEVLWQSAIAHLDFAQVLTNPEQYKRYASIARKEWKDYIDWFDRLSGADRTKLPAGHIRINAATSHLGNAIIRMEEQHLIFDDYKNIPSVDYLGTDAIELWKNTLYQCPDWRAVDARTPRVRRQKICAEDCTNEWLSYAATLSEWAAKYRLRTAARESYVREARQIQEIAKTCQNP